MSEQINAKKIAFLNAFLQIEENISTISELGYLLRDDAKIIDMWFDKVITIWKELNPLLKPGTSHTWHLGGENGIKDPRYWDTGHGNRLTPSAFSSLRRVVLYAEYQCDSMVPRLEEFRKHIHTFLAKTPFQRDVPAIKSNDPILATDKLTILEHLNELESILLRHREVGVSFAIDRTMILHHQGALLTAFIKLSQNLVYVSEEERETEMSGLLNKLEGVDGGFWDSRFITRTQDGQAVVVSSMAFHLTRQAIIEVVDQRPDINYLLTTIVKAVEKEIWG